MPHFLGKDYASFFGGRLCLIFWRKAMPHFWGEGYVSFFGGRLCLIFGGRLCLFAETVLSSNLLKRRYCEENKIETFQENLQVSSKCYFPLYGFYCTCQVGTARTSLECIYLSVFRKVL